MLLKSFIKVSSFHVVLSEEDWNTSVKCSVLFSAAGALLSMAEIAFVVVSTGALIVDAISVLVVPSDGSLVNDSGFGSVTLCEVCSVFEAEIEVVYEDSVVSGMMYIESDSSDVMEA